MQEINQEAFSFLQTYDVNFARTQEQLDTAETEVKRFEILFEAVIALAKDSTDTELLEKASALAQRAHESSTLDFRGLSIITATFNTILSKIDQNQEFNQLLNNWDASQEVKQIVLECRKNKTDSLNLINKGLSSFPSTLLQHLPHIKTLDLLHNHLTSFTLEGSSQLQYLYLSRNHLTSFTLERASQLRDLDLSQNHLTSFTLEGASQLQTLELDDNQLTSFTLEGASQLQHLNLEGNQLTQEPLLLNCAVPEILDVSGNPYLTTSSGVDKNIIEQRLSLFTIMLDNSSSEIEALKRLSVDQIFEVFEAENPSLIPQIDLWLQKLQTARDFKDVRNKEEFAYNVLSIIYFALKTPEFREPLDLALEQANRSCVDRCSLFLNEAIQAKKTYELGIMSLQEAITFLKGSYALKIIHNLASEFVESRRVPLSPDEHYNPNETIIIDEIAYRDTLDPIEVYIDLQCRLKDDFSLPIAIKEQNYQSSVTPELEARVRENVQMALKDTPSLTEYFCSFPSWIEKIKREYGEELQVGFDKINADMEKFMESEEFRNATEDAKKALILPYQEQAIQYSEEFSKKKTKQLLTLLSDEL